MDELLAEREKINARIHDILDSQTEPWGIKEVLVEWKEIDLPQEMQLAMAKQAEAERERRAKVIHAEGEFQASQTLADEAEVSGKQPIAMHLRFVKSLVEVAADNNSTIVRPLPVDLLRRFLTYSGRCFAALRLEKAKSSSSVIADMYTGASCKKIYRNKETAAESSLR